MTADGAPLAAYGAAPGIVAAAHLCPGAAAAAGAGAVWPVARVVGR